MQLSDFQWNIYVIVAVRFPMLQNKNSSWKFTEKRLLRQHFHFEKKEKQLPMWNQCNSASNKSLPTIFPLLLFFLFSLGLRYVFGCHPLPRNGVLHFRSTCFQLSKTIWLEMVECSREMNRSYVRSARIASARFLKTCTFAEPHTTDDRRKSSQLVLEIKMRTHSVALFHLNGFFVQMKNDSSESNYVHACSNAFPNLV